MSEYRVAPRAVATPFAPVPVALAAATTKTVLQVNIPSGQDIRLLGWGVSFDGVSGTGIPVVCQLIEGDVAALHTLANWCCCKVEGSRLVRILIRD